MVKRLKNLMGSECISTEDVLSKKKGTILGKQLQLIIGAFHVDQRIQIRQELEEGDQRAGAVVSLQLIFIPTRWFFKFKICVEKLKK